MLLPMCLFRTRRAFGVRLMLLALVVAVLAALSPDPGFAKSASDRKQTRSTQQGHTDSPKAAKKSSGKAHRKAHRKVPIPVGEEGMRLNVKAAYLMNMNTGSVYFAQDPDAQIPPASVTKVLTLFVLRDAMAQRKLSPDTRIPVSSLAIRTGGSTMTLYKGEKVPLSEIIKGISVVSANNACVAVAEYLGQGDSRRFVAMMNAKAKSLGMTRSRFMNPNGLPASGQVTTARDLAKLSAAYLKRYPESLAIHSMTSHTYNGVTHRNANSLLGRYEGCGRPQDRVRVRLGLQHLSHGKARRHPAGGRGAGGQEPHRPRGGDGPAAGIRLRQGRPGAGPQEAPARQTRQVLQAGRQVPAQGQNGFLRPGDPTQLRIVLHDGLPGVDPARPFRTRTYICCLTFVQ